MHPRGDLVHLVPGNADEAAASDPGREPTEAAAPAPGGGAPTRIGDDPRLAVAHTLELEVVDLAAAPAVTVEQLVVEDAEREVDLAVIPAPCCERSSSGIAATAITSTTTR